MTRCYADALFTHDGHPGSTWEDFAVVRWFSQIAYGVVPGLLILWAVLHLAAQPVGNGTPTSCSASVFPLLGITSAADSSSFHRYRFDHNQPADVAPKFRLPDPERRDTGKPKHILTVTKRVSALPVRFEAPRQSWQHLSAATRSLIDAGLKATSSTWQRVVLHGSGTQTGSAKLLDRYQQSLRRSNSDGPAYHFIIGNGTQTGDGQIEASERWTAARAAATNTANPGLSVCLIGDFNAQAPSVSQLEALDELLDYLTIKLGPLPVKTHHRMSGKDSSCLGIKFPEEAVLKALSGADTTFQVQHSDFAK